MTLNGYFALPHLMVRRILAFRQNCLETCTAMHIVPVTKNLAQGTQFLAVYKVYADIRRGSLAAAILATVNNVISACFSLKQNGIPV